MSRLPDSSQRGFTLLEVLITIVLIAGALLGTAGMQAAGLKLTQGSQFRSQAVLLSSDIIERLEANNTGAKIGAYVRDPVVGGGGTPQACNLAVACDATQLAAFDLNLFEDSLLAQLPQPSAKITRVGTGPWVYSVEVKWKETTYKSKGTTATGTGAADTIEFSYTINRTVYDRGQVL